MVNREIRLHKSRRAFRSRNRKSLTAGVVTQLCYNNNRSYQTAWEATMLGVTNIMELSDDGRTTQCYSCGRTIVFETYYKKAYVYV